MPPFSGRIPPPEFRGHTQRAARPVPTGEPFQLLTSPRSPREAAAARPHQPQRPSRAVLASWQRLHRLLPVRAVPEQDRITPVRHDMVDHDGTLQPSLGSACDAKRIALEEPPTGPPPAGAVAPTCRTWTLPLRSALTATALRAPSGRCIGGFHGNALPQQHKTRRGGLSRHTLRAWVNTTSCMPHCPAEKMMIYNGKSRPSAGGPKGTPRLPPPKTGLRTASRPGYAALP
jgi:hypothetical protein